MTIISLVILLNDYPADLVTLDRFVLEYTGEIFYLQHNHNQNWYWSFVQTPEMMLLSVTYDSDQQGGPTRKPRLQTWPVVILRCAGYGSFVLSRRSGGKGGQCKAHPQDSLDHCI